MLSKRPSQSFRKAERLTRKKLLADLFAKKGQTFVVHPFRVVWMWAELPHDVPAQLAISVPKRKLRRAPDRNRIKRLVRESYRKHKYIHYTALEKDGKQLAMMLIYLGGKELSYAECEGKIILTLQRLVKKCKHRSGPA